MSAATATEVAPGVHRLGDRLVNWWLVVDGGRATVIDAGLPGQYPQLRSLLAALDLSVDAVEAVVVTHGHLDHLACVSHLRAEAGPTVYVPRGDRELAARKPKPDLGMLRHSLNPAGMRTAVSYLRQGVARARPVVDATALDDGETLDLPGRPRFLHAPGHTAGGGMFVLADRGVLFSGDVLVTLDPFSGATGPRTLPAFDNVDHDLAVASLDLVAGTGTDVILPGHGEPWRGAAEEATALARRASAA